MTRTGHVNDRVESDDSSERIGRQVEIAHVRADEPRLRNEFAGPPDSDRRQVYPGHPLARRKHASHGNAAATTQVEHRVVRLKGFQELRHPPGVVAFEQPVIRTVCVGDQVVAIADDFYVIHGRVQTTWRSADAHPTLNRCASPAAAQMKYVTPPCSTSMGYTLPMLSKPFVYMRESSTAKTLYRPPGSARLPERAHRRDAVALATTGGSTAGLRCWQHW